MSTEAERVLREALEAIAELTPDGLGQSWDEWGEAACYQRAVEIAAEALASTSTEG